MTRSELGTLREDVAAGLAHLALLRIDAELATPAVREWRVKVTRKDGTRFTNWRAKNFEEATEMAAPHKNYRCVIECRTPAGPWERAE